LRANLEKLEDKAYKKTESEALEADKLKEEGKEGAE